MSIDKTFRKRNTYMCIICESYLRFNPTVPADIPIDFRSDSPRLGGMRGHRGMEDALLDAFAIGRSTRAVPPLARFLVGTGSDLDELEGPPFASIESKVVVEDTLPPPITLGTVAGPYMIRPRGWVLYERSAYLKH